MQYYIGYEVEVEIEVNNKRENNNGYWYGYGFEDVIEHATILFQIIYYLDLCVIVVHLEKI